MGGHGQSDALHLPSKKKKLPADALTKFQSFIDRIAQHRGADWIQVTHSRTDKQSRWDDVVHLVEALNEGQRAEQLPEVDVQLLELQEQDITSEKKNKSHHA